MTVLALEIENTPGIFGRLEGRRRGRLALLRGCVEGSCGALFAKSREGGMGDTGSLEELAEFSGLGAGVGLL